MPAVVERIDRLEEVVTSFMEESRRFQAEMRENIKQIRESNARTDAQLLKMQEQAQKDREEARIERISFNKRMAELSDSMGTLVEDMVVPNVRRIAAQIFPDDPVLDISPYAERQRGGDTMEIDLLAAGRRNVMVVESKRRLRPDDPD